MFFDTYWVLVTWNLLKNELIRVLEVKAMPISNFSEINNGIAFSKTNQIYIGFFDIGYWKCGVMIESLGDFFADEY